MSDPTPYEIVIRGRASARLLRPLLDDFTFDHTGEGRTRLVGQITDAAHLHGLVAHLASVNVDVISIAPRGAPAVTAPTDQRDEPPRVPITPPPTHRPRSTQP